VLDVAVHDVAVLDVSLGAVVLALSAGLIMSAQNGSALPRAAASGAADGAAPK
jgi:hypothetical protein